MVCLYKGIFFPIKGNEVLIHAATMINLDTSWSIQNETPNVTYCMIPFMLNFQSR